MPRPCPKCERPNNERASRCLYCGAPFPEAPPPAPKPTAKPAAGPSVAPASAAAPAPAPTPAKPKQAEVYLAILSPGQALAGESLVAFARELGTDDYTARQRLKYPAPRFLRVFPTPEESQAFISRLHQLGLDAYVLKQSGVDKVAQCQQAVGVKSLGGDGPVFLDAQGHELALRGPDLVLIVRGRIREKPERDEDIEEDRPTVNLGKMTLGPEDQGQEERGALGEVLDRIDLRPRVSRLRWVLRGGLSNEIMDLYHRGDHRPLRLVESEFDYSGLGETMGPSGLLNFKAILARLQELAPAAKVDVTFNIVGYTLSDVPKQDKVKTELETLYGASDSARKIVDNRAFFNDHSARVYLHLLREQSLHRPGHP